MSIHYIMSIIAGILLGGCFGTIIGDIFGRIIFIRDFNKWKFTKEFQLELILALVILGVVLRLV